MKTAMKVRKSPKRIIVDVPEEFHQKVKAHAVFLHLPIRTWVLRALIKKLKEEDATRKE